MPHLLKSGGVAFASSNVNRRLCR